jgi:ABC-type glycerol-3-phosphate transport system substrate-binding protein
MNHIKFMNIGVFSMKKIWKICAVALSAAILTVFAGCSARTAISADEFQKQAKSAGYTVTEPENDSSAALKTYVATKDGSDVEIDFHSFANAYSAHNWYSDRKNSMKSGTTKTVVDSDNYSKYTVSNGEIRYVLVRVDKTVILCKAIASKAGEIDSFLNTIKY